MNDLLGLIPLGGVTILMTVMAFIVWRQEHPKTKHRS